MSAAFNGWTGRADVKLDGVPQAPRVLDVLDCAWAHRLATHPRDATSAQLARGFWANPSQAVQRRPWGTPGCLTSSAVWYSFEKDTALDAEDCLRIQGLPTRIQRHGLSEAEAKNLAGEAFSCPVATMFTAAWYYLPWGAWWEG